MNKLSITLIYIVTIPILSSSGSDISLFVSAMNNISALDTNGVRCESVKGCKEYNRQLSIVKNELKVGRIIKTNSKYRFLKNFSVKHMGVFSIADGSNIDFGIAPSYVLENNKSESESNEEFDKRLEKEINNKVEKENILYATHRYNKIQFEYYFMDNIVAKRDITDASIVEQFEELEVGELFEGEIKIVSPISYPPNYDLNLLKVYCKILKIKRIPDGLLIDEDGNRKDSKK